MRWIGVACIVCVAHGAAAECFSSPHQVWAVHPGSHPRWHLINHQQCWRAYPSAHASRDRRTTAPVPPPLPPLRYDRLLPVEGRALAHELLGD